MRVFTMVCCIFFGFITFGSSCYGLTIVEPPAGSIFHPGDKVKVTVVPSPTEAFQAVFIYAGKLAYSTIDIDPPYELEFTIKPDFLGKDKIVASGKLLDNKIVETEIGFEVVLPSTVRLERMEVDPTLMFLQKLPSGSDPNKERIYGTERIGVAGIYTDGYKRNIASSSFGTTYRSSNEEIVTVDAEGLATARKPGQAKIVVSNSGKEITVDVIVKAKDH